MAWKFDVRDLRIKNHRGATLLGVREIQVTFDRCIGIIGESGAGKTILSRALAGVLPYSVTCSGIVDMTRLRGANTIVLQKTDMQFIPQSPASALPRAITCGALLAKVYAWTGRKADEESVDIAFQRAGLNGRQVGRLQASQLSGGMAQRLTIAIAIANNAQFVVFDEPTLGLDLEGKEQALSLIESLQDLGRGIAIVSHDRACAHLFDEVIVVENRSVRAVDRNGP